MPRKTALASSRALPGGECFRWACCLRLPSSGSAAQQAGGQPARGCAACAARDQVIAEQGRVIEELRAEVADLRRRLGRNSQNSSMPPSADDLPGRVPPKREQRGKASKRGRGKQPGAPGAAMTWAQPDEVVDHRPAGACDSCGSDLTEAADLGVGRSFQQLEVPLMTARRIQHDLHQARCQCGKLHLAGRPEGVPGSAVSIGANLRALAVYLVVFQHVPIERCARLIADLTGAQVSAGFVHSCLAKAAAMIADVVKLIKTLITAAHVAGFDETTLRCGPAGTRKYVLAAVTESYSLFFLGRRTLESFREFGVLPAFTGVVVSDRYANYFHPGWEHIAGNQVCLAHLVRDYQDAAECYPGAIWPVQAHRALRGLIRAWHTARDAGQPEIPRTSGTRCCTSSVTPCSPGCLRCHASPAPSTPPPSIPAGTCWNSAPAGRLT